MGKQLIHAYVDDSTYLFIKANVKNVSALVNNLLNAYAENEQLEIPQEAEILRELDEQKKILAESKERMSQLSVMLAKVRSDAEEQAKEDEQIRNDQHELARQMFTARAKGDL